MAKVTTNITIDPDLLARIDAAGAEDWPGRYSRSHLVGITLENWLSERQGLRGDVEEGLLQATSELAKRRPVRQVNPIPKGSDK